MVEGSGSGFEVRVLGFGLLVWGFWVLGLGFGDDANSLKRASDL